MAAVPNLDDVAFLAAVPNPDEFTIGSRDGEFFAAAVCALSVFLDDLIMDIPGGIGEPLTIARAHLRHGNGRPARQGS